MRRHPLRLALLACGLLPLGLGGPSPAADTGGWTVLFDGTGFDAWKGPTAEWFLAGAVHADAKNPRLLAAEPGQGIMVNGKKGKTKNLLSKESFGDIELHLEFLIPQRSNSGVKFQGQYEIQIFDSYGKKELTGSDCGGIYPKAELLPRYHYLDKGVPPRVNACKAPGEWQTLDAVFLSPRFDAEGKKTASARFVKVVLNGQTIHENTEVNAPTGHAWHDPEHARGPILLQADHGPVAFRNIRVRAYTEKK